MSVELLTLAAGSTHIAFPDLGLNPIIFEAGPVALRWYSVAYLAGIFVGYWYLLKLIAQPGSPMARPYRAAVRRLSSRGPRRAARR